MKKDRMEDLKDSEQIKKLKKEYKNSKKDMATWKFGKGLKKKEENKGGI